MLPNITVSLNTCYYCNFNCSWCYLTPTQLNDKTILAVNKIEDMLEELSQYYNICHFDIYGGEPTLLPNNYTYNLIDLLRSYNAHINVITNLSHSTHPILYMCDTVGISYDYNKREQHEKVKYHISKTSFKRHIITLLTSDFSKDDVMYLIEELIDLNVDSLELKPFSPNIYYENYNMLEYTKFFEEMVKFIIQLDPPFTLINKINMDNLSNSFSNDHIYITPAGTFAVLDFKNDKEIFVDVTIDEYKLWCEKELTTYSNHKKCNKCDYNGACLSEHLLVINDTCNGYPGLIKWYKSQ